MSIFLSTGAFQTRDINSIIQICISNGIEKVELSSGVKYRSNLLEIIFKAKDEIDFLLHNYFPPHENPFVLNLASLNDETLQKSRQHCKNSIDLCVKLGSPFYSVHSGFALKLKPELLGDPEAQSNLSKDLIVPYETAYQRFVESLIEINRYAKSKGISFIIENNVLTSYHVKNGLKSVFFDGYAK